MNERPMPLTGREAAYQIVMIAAILELGALAVVSPRSIPAAPQVVIGVSAIRLLALIAQAGLVRDVPPRSAWPALLVWAGILWPPELWAHALEATALEAWRTGFGSVLFALAMHTVARRVGAWWWIIAALFAATVLVGAISPLEELLGWHGPRWLLLAIPVALYGAYRERAPIGVGR